MGIVDPKSICRSYVSFRTSHDHYWGGKRCKVVVATTPEIIAEEADRATDILLNNNSFGEGRWPLEVKGTKNPFGIMCDLKAKLDTRLFYTRAVDEARDPHDLIGEWEPTIYAREHGKRPTRAFLTFPPSVQKYLAGVVKGFFRFP